MSTQQTGRVSVDMDGVILKSKPGAKLTIGGVKREHSVDDQLNVYHQESYTPGMIECTLVHVADTDLVAIRNFKNGTVRFKCDTGKVYESTNADCAEVGDMQNGECTVKFGGDWIR